MNTGKTKIMAFFETPALLRARGGQHQPGPTMPPFHVYSPFPTSDPRPYPIHKVSQFEYLGLILDFFFLGGWSLRAGPPPPLEWNSFPPLVTAVLITTKGAESPGSRRIGVIGTLVLILSSQTV